MKIKRLIYSAAVALLMAAPATAQTQEYTPSPENIRSRQQFQEDRFGIFIHWGIYSMFAQGEWYLQNYPIDKNEYAKAIETCEKYNNSEAIVVSVKRKKDTISPSKLYSLSKLQNVLGKKYKISMTDSLAIVQKLYEEGYLTYPRTNSEYLATAEKDKVKKNT